MFSNRIRSARRSRRRSNYKPALENLENRLALTAGALDPTFGTGGKVLTDFPVPVDLTGNDEGHSVAIQQGDQLVVAGTSRSFLSGEELAVARYKADGSLDKSFGDGGRVRDSFPTLQAITGMAVQADGKIVVAGYAFSNVNDFFVARLNSDGSLDTSFDGDGWLTTDFGGGDDLGQSVAIQADGKIVVAGYSESDTTIGFDFALARYNSNGSLDASFGGDGLVTTDFGFSNDFGFGVAIQDDQQIVVAGQTSADFVTSDFGLARYNSDGTLDSNFGVGGLVTTDFGGGTNDVAFSVAVRGGVIVAAGETDGTFNSDFGMAEYDASGNLNLGFGSGGKATADFGGFDSAASVAIQTDGKVVAAGTNLDDFAVARFNADGTPDTSFGGAGEVTTDFNGELDFGNSVVLQADGKIVAAGTAFQSDFSSDFAVVRYKTDGTLDGSFGNGGKVTTDFPVTQVSADDAGRQVVIQQTDGKIVVGGTSQDNIFGFSAVALARYNADGTLDKTFGDGGRVRDILWPSVLEVTSIALQANGKIVVAGYGFGENFDNDFFVARYNQNGTRDKSFGNGGWVNTDFGGSDDLGASVAIQSDGKIVVAGPSAPVSTADYDFAVARYNSNGTLDTSFGAGGLVKTDFGGTPDIAFSVALDGSGRILVAGASNQPGTDSDFALARYDRNGQLDPSFDGDGRVLTDFGFSTDIASSIALQSDGKIVVSGVSDVSSPDLGDFALARYTSSGALDSSFDGDGLITTDFAGLGDWAFSVAVLADGHIVAAGISTQPSTGSDFGLALYTSDGSLDASFGSGGLVTTDFGSEDAGQSVAVQADGKIVVAGVSYQGFFGNDFAVARYQGVSAMLQTDTCDPTKTELVVGGTTGDDKIVIQKVGSTWQVEVKLNGTSLGTFNPTGRIVVHGYAGNDDIQVVGGVSNSVWLYGESGDDRLNAGDGNDVLLGGEGNDTLQGGNGRDLLIGGAGSDRLLGSADDDILVAGTTDHDANEVALCQIMDEWTRTDASFATRVGHLKGPAGGLNGGFFLNDQTVHDDGAQDLLTGSSGSDWFLLNQDGDGDPTTKDKVTDSSSLEASLAQDIDAP